MSMQALLDELDDHIKKLYDPDMVLFVPAKHFEAAHAAVKEEGAVNVTLGSLISRGFTNIRFRDRWIILDPMTGSDFDDMRLQDILKTDPLPPPVIDKPDVYTDATKSVYTARKYVALALLALALLAFTVPAFAHSWYDPSCCSTQDCAPIPAHAVTKGPDGWHVRIEQGEHPLVMFPIEEVVPFDEALPSQDGDFHACVRAAVQPGSTDSRIICLYVPDVGAGA